MQSEVSFQSEFERGQRLCCSDVYRKVIPPSWGQNRQQLRTRCAGVTGQGGGGVRCPEVAEQRGLAGVQGLMSCCM